MDSVESYLSLVVTLQNLVAFMLYDVGLQKFVDAINMLCPVTLLSEIWEARVPAS